MDTDTETIINDQNEAGTLYAGWLTITEEIAADIEEGTMSFEISGYEDLAGNVGDVIKTTTNNTSVTFDKTAPALRELRVQNFYNPNGKEYEQYSGLTQNPGQNKGIAITVNTTELLSKNPIIVIGGKEIEVPVQEPQFNKYVVYVDLTEDMDLVEGEKIPVTVKGLEDLAGNTGDEVTSTGNDKYYVIFDKTAPKTLANNILKFGESNEQREYYVRPGDSIYMCYTANEELGHNPTFTLINNGKEYVMEDSQVIVKQNPAKAWDYTVIYEIPADTTFVDGEIELKVSNIEDKAGNKREDVNGPTNGHKVYFDTTAPEKLNLGIARNKDEGDTRDQRYAKAGDSIRVLVSFPEKLAVEPKVEMFGKVYDVTYRPKSSIEESNIYYYMADVKIDQNTPEGDVVFKVYGYKDVAGNEGLPLTNADINDGKYTNVIIDNTNPTILPTEDSVGSEGNYSKIGLKVTDNNGVASYEINGQDGAIIFTNGEVSSATLARYLNEGENTITARDEAGNEATFKFTYDITKPTYNFARIQSNNKENSGYAKVGNNVWVYVNISEELSVKPKFKINGIELEVKQERQVSSGTQYATWLTMTEDMKEGPVSFEVYGYTDLAGNVGDTITQTKENDVLDTTSVIFDKTAPGFVSDPWTITVEANKDIEFPKELYPQVSGNDNFSGEVTPELVNVYVDMGRPSTSDTEYKLQYVTRDEAGNEAYNDVFVIVKDTTAPTIKVDGKDETIEAGSQESYTIPEATVTDNADITHDYKVRIVYYPDYENDGHHKDVPAVDTKQPGVYAIIYSYTDDGNNTAREAVVKVTVTDTTKPDITLVGEKYNTLKKGEQYNELGANMTDNSDASKKLTEPSRIDWYGPNGEEEFSIKTGVDTSRVGRYVLFYSYEDASGNYQEAMRVVYVED